MEIITANQKAYNVIRLLGHGKGGYSYLVEKDGCLYVLKQIHHEPCEYYSFGNKIEAEINDYKRLLQTGIRLPRMLDVDIENERIVKEYIDGPTIYELVKDDAMDDSYVVQVREMAQMVFSAGLNIDFFPTNFVVANELIFYIDYECNLYMDEWNFENWGIKYWSKTAEFEEYMNAHQLAKFQLSNRPVFGQRINIVIEIPRKDEEGTVSFVSGWMVEPNGKLKLNTPYGGK